MRPLLPAQRADPSIPAVVGSSSRSGPPKRISHVPSACLACRKRKTKCSGVRPRCSACVGRKSECRYEAAVEETTAQAVKRKYRELKDAKSASEKLVDALQFRPEAESLAIYKRLRMGDDTETIMRHVEYGDVLLQVALAPEARYRYVFPFCSDMPQYLYKPWNPYLHSLLFEWTAIKTHTGELRQQPTRIQDETAAAIKDPYLKPFHAAEVVDARLELAEPSKWTTVSTDDRLMRKLLASYLRQDYSYLTMFHKDHFLDDMAKMRKQFCSSLLVNAVLAIACAYCRSLPDRDDYENPHTLGYRFLAEARRLWDEDDTSRITSIQAALFLNFVYDMCTLDKVGLAFEERAAKMAEDLQLFKALPEIRSRRQRSARAITAWALFNWQSTMCFHFFRPPLIAEPPEWELPDPAQNPELYGELWLRYPLNATLFPVHFGHVFKARSELCVILNDANKLLFPKAETKFTAKDVVELYMRFTKWHAKLPDVLKPRNIVLTSHLKLHIQYYYILIQLLKTLEVLGGSKDAESATSSFTTPYEEIITEAKGCFETLLRMYYLRHGFEHLDPYLAPFLSTQGFMAIQGTGTDEKCPDIPSRRSTMALIVKAIHDQSQSMKLSKIVFRLMRDSMSQEDRDLVSQFAGLGIAWEKQDTRKLETRSEWPVKVSSAADDPESKKLGVLMKHYREDDNDGTAGDLSGDDV